MTGYDTIMDNIATVDDSYRHHALSDDCTNHSMILIERVHPYVAIALDHQLHFL